MNDFEMACSIHFPYALPRLGSSEFGQFYCGQGWYNNLYRFFERLQAWNVFRRILSQPTLEVVYVGNKEGHICVETKLIADETQSKESWKSLELIYEDMLSDLKNACAKTCEICGKTDPVFSSVKGHTTECKDCYAEYEAFAGSRACEDDSAYNRQQQ